MLELQVLPVMNMRIYSPNALHSAAKTSLFWREQLPLHLIVKNAYETLF